ncbi:hypothetical protein [Salibacterium lacus]|uniref:Lipoprotein n=1 Tax=Salibacterium lacus TaxID=1898109 RepID=A0ABW5T593_9BACI
MKKRITAGAVVLGCLFLFGGCGRGDSGVDIQVYADDVKKGWSSAEQAAVPENTTVHVYPSLVEKFIVEVAGHKGDIFIVEEPMLKAALEPEGLHPLQELSEENGGTLGASAFRKEEDTLYAAVIREDAPLLQHVDVSLNKPLIAVIPVYSDQKEQSLDILKQALEQPHRIGKGRGGTWNSTG